MNDVMKKRLIGIAVLVVIGVLAPLLLSQCMHSDDEDSDRSSMRVYDVNPDGSAKSGAQSADDNAATNENKPDEPADKSQDRQGSQPSLPDAVSPQSVPDRSSDSEDFSTPDVAGNQNSNPPTTEKPSSSRNQPAEPRSGDNASAKPQSRPQANEQPSRPKPQAQAKPQSGPQPEQARNPDTGSNSAQRNDSASGWVVQIASFGDEGNARAMVKKLASDYRSSYAQVSVNGKTWYRVNVGPFASEEAARSTADSLRKQGRKSLVRHLP